MFGEALQAAQRHSDSGDHGSPERRGQSLDHPVAQSLNLLIFIVVLFVPAEQKPMAHTGNHV
ncbi:MAG TPA: hypothetical protein VKB87_11660, partial [Myxococcaceae bacterium]|nr:hypothetical protein [Myxococcaceae bacterium]